VYLRAEHVAVAGSIAASAEAAASDDVDGDAEWQLECFDEVGDVVVVESDAS
jgi:hypothetical protein